MKLTNRKSFLLRDVVISIIFFCGIVALFLLVVMSVSNNYDRSDMIDQNFANNFNKLNTLIGGNNGLEVTSNATRNPTGMQLQGNFDIAFSSTWTVFNLVWSAIDVYTGFGKAIESQFTFIPSSVIVIISLTLIASLVAVVIFTIISSILRGRI
jgi:hypothetical protein